MRNDVRKELDMMLLTVIGAWTAISIPAAMLTGLGLRRVDRVAAEREVVVPLRRAA